MNRSADKETPWTSVRDVDTECNADLRSGHELSHLILTPCAIVNSWHQIEHFHSETGKLQSQDPEPRADTEIIEREAGWAGRDLFFWTKFIVSGPAGGVRE